MVDEEFPNNMDELEKTFYGKNNDGLNVDFKKITSYIDKTRTEILSPSNEKFVKKIFEPLGNVEKIEELRDEKTSDYVIKEKKILVEVTSLNTDEGREVKFSSKKISKKIRKSIKHITEKTDSRFNGYVRGGVIISGFIFNFYTYFHQWLKTYPDEIKKMIPDEIKFLLFLHDPTSFNDNARVVNRPVLFVRKKCISELKAIRYYSDFIICEIDQS